MRSIYLFVDGAHLNGNYQRVTSPWFNGEGKLDFTKIKVTFDAQKCFYYDCLDDIKGQEESDSAYAKRVEEQEAFFNSISEIPGWHVRLGSLSGKGKKRRQKEVDILLAVDMLNHAVRDNLLRATLLTGDRDFKPVVDSLVQMGVIIGVAGDESQTSKPLARAADSFTPLTFSLYFDWTDNKVQQKYPVEIQQINMPPSQLPIIRTGTWNGKNIFLTMGQGGYVFYLDVPNYNDTNHLALQGNDSQRMMLYFELLYGKVDWSS